MFQRRLKILLTILVLVTGLLLLRAFQIQVVQADHWRQRAADSMKRPQLLETVRGRILDLKGTPLASDEPCIDAAVLYSAIQRDPAWIRSCALGRLKARPGYADADRSSRRRMLDEEILAVGRDLDGMWRTLADVSGKSMDDIEQVKTEIRQHVLIRRRFVWYKNFELAQKQYERRPDEPWYKEWLLSGEDEPELKSFEIDVTEQFEAHVILPAISVEVHNLLKKRLEQLPGLVLRPSKHRYYHFGDVACHVLGHLSTVTRDDLKVDPNSGNELRRYHYNDVVGRGGVESLCEQALRGTRGRIVTMAGRDAVVERIEPVDGQDVYLTLDIHLQQDIQKAFERAEWRDENGRLLEGPHEMHGAAVVIDVPTGHVRALVSYPTYDVNKYDEQFRELRADTLNKPLLNRALQQGLEPGSTIKPVVGLGAITAGLVPHDHEIYCTGHFYYKGNKMSVGRCWVASMWEHVLGPEGVKGHQVPVPHPTGRLSFADALERSCNIFFETLGEQMGTQGLGYWYFKFGIGQVTGIGLPEYRGRTPLDMHPAEAQQPAARWFSAIGQVGVQATPIQMANVAATIAREGIWVRPRLLMDEAQRPDRDHGGSPDRVDLQLSPQAVAAARRGMKDVIATVAGTGHKKLKQWSGILAGKTGTAQVTRRFSHLVMGPDGRYLRNDNGTYVRVYPQISTRAHPNPQARWYRGSGTHEDQLDHAWFIGFAPADRPQIALCVMLEYGGSGGSDAAFIVNAVLEACVKHGYLR